MGEESRKCDTIDCNGIADSDKLFCPKCREMRKNQEEIEASNALKKKPLFKAMDRSQIAMLVTYDEAVFYEMKMLMAKGDAEFDDTNSTAKEPTPDNMSAKATYPLEYVLDFLKLATRHKTTHITFEMGKNTPIRMSFVKDRAGKGEMETLLWLAPRVSND